MISLDRLEIPNLGFSRIFVIARIRYKNRCELINFQSTYSIKGIPHGVLTLVYVGNSIGLEIVGIFTTRAHCSIGSMRRHSTSTDTNRSDHDLSTYRTSLMIEKSGVGFARELELRHPYH